MRLISFLAVLCFFSCNIETKSPDDTVRLVPKPLSVTQSNGVYTLTADASISFTSELLNEANYLSSKTGFTKDQKQESSRAIHLELLKDEENNSPESYKLEVNKNGIHIQAPDQAGIFYGIQSLIQLLPASVLKTNLLKGNADINFVTIEDKPRFPYRGMHLDVCRHFFSPDEVKKYIDLLAFHKMNKFHWHLTEDQGWRIEIKKYPKLQEQAAFRKETLIGHYNDQPHKYDGKRYGGFYTQDEIKDIVTYAQERHITIIPEIELPGHSQAALTAYPELGCTEGPFEVLTKWGVSNEVYCPTEETFTFLENVLLEVMELFPSEYIHIGGDECPKIRWKESAFCQKLIKDKNLKDEHGLQSYFIGRIEKFLNSHGRNIIGWDEILEGGLAPNATVMSWRGVAGGIEAAKQKHNVIMTPNSHCYLDYYQSDHTDEPLAIGGFLPLKTVYSYEPIPEELTSEQQKYIQGIQGNVWTEYIPTFEKLEYMAFPRATAIAEIGWSTAEKDYEDFLNRLDNFTGYLDALDVNYANHISDVKAKTIQNNGLKIELSSENQDSEIRYTLDGNMPNKSSTLYDSPISVNKSIRLVAKSFSDDKAIGREAELDLDFHKAVGKQISLKEMPADRYSKGGIQAVINGIKGSDERYGDKEWLGFNGNDFEAIIDLGQSTEISEIQMRFFKGEGQWIYLPKTMRFSISDHGRSYDEIIDTKVGDTSKKVMSSIVRFTEPKYGRYLKVEVPNYGIIPEGKQGGGNAAWLFIDEIIVK